MEVEKVVVICSGGMDSVTLLHMAHLENRVVAAISFDYGSKHNEAELKCAEYQANVLKIPHFKFDLDFMTHFGSKSSLLSSAKIPQGHYEDESMKSTVVPNRNMIMLAIAVGFADANGASKVLIGSHKGDRAQYPDCTEEFTQSINLASMLATENRVKIESPFNNLMKWEILNYGLKLLPKIDYSRTHSCYEGRNPPCSKCGTCVERTESFVRCKIQDPLYPDKRSWEEAVNFMNKAKIAFIRKVRK